MITVYQVELYIIKEGSSRKSCGGQKIWSRIGSVSKEGCNGQEVWAKM